MNALFREGRATLLLAFPLIAGQVSQMLMGVVDTLMIGRLGTVDLAAATLAHTILQIPLMVGIGVSIAVSIKVSQARGAKDPARAKDAVRHGFFLSMVLGVLTFAVSLAMLPLLPHLGQAPAVVARMPGFFLLISVSMAPALASMAARSHADAMARPWPAFWIILAGVFLNVFLNWLLIGGNWGAPEMGLEGAGLATLIARLASVVGVVIWLVMSPSLREWVPVHWFRLPEFKAFREFWKIAWPASLQISAEMGAFIFAAFVIGKMGAAALAAHQVAFVCVSTIFMVPLGLSMAVTVRIGDAFGAKTHERARPIVLGAWAMGLTFSLVFVAIFLVFGETISRWFLTDAEPLQIAFVLFGIAAVFQIGDHSQIISSGVLRGLDDVRTPALMTFVAHWLIGMPVGIYLAFSRQMGPAGMWWGLSAGLSIAAIFLGKRAWKQTAPVVEVT